jgi:hypothetical protein
MPANIQVLLRQDIDKLGKSGELVRVRPGFARNFLLPRQLAVAATTAAVHRIEHERAVVLRRSVYFGRNRARPAASRAERTSRTRARSTPGSRRDRPKDTGLLRPLVARGSSEFRAGSTDMTDLRAACTMASSPSSRRVPAWERPVSS